jgi:hypothetical protein
VLCVGIDDQPLLEALREHFTLLQADSCGSALEMLEDAAPDAVLLCATVDQDSHDAHWAGVLSSVKRIRRSGAREQGDASAPLPVFLAMYGAVETMVTAAAVVTAAAAAIIVQTSITDGIALPPSVLSQSSSVALLTPLVATRAARSATAAVLQVVPELSQLIDAALGAEDAPPAVLHHLVAPVLASAPALAKAAAAGVVKAAVEAGDALRRAAMLAGASACFVVPLLRADLADRLVDCLRVIALHAEAKASAALLRKVLPDRVTERLKNGQSFYAEAMPCVSILFVDVCQFTVLSSVLEPIQIVVLLNELFSGAQLPQRTHTGLHALTRQARTRSFRRSDRPLWRVQGAFVRQHVGVSVVNQLGVLTQYACRWRPSATA